MCGLGRLPLSLTHSLTHSLSHSLIHSFIHYILSKFTSVCVIAKMSDSSSDSVSSSGGSPSNSFFSEIKDLLPVDNPVFSGGFGLAVLGIGTQLLRKGSGIAMQMARKNLLVTLEVTSKDKSYPWVLQWLTLQGTRTQHLSVETTLRASVGGGGISTNFGFVPSPGFHLLRFRNQFLGVERMREQQMMDLNTGKPWEKVQFIGIGRDTSIFEHILRESFELASAKEEGKTIIYTNWGTEWRPFGQPRSRRELDSVILDEGLAEKIDKDICEWQESAGWYRDRGIPYRRGYLLYGPPGSG
jgi:chaperone BCS1